MEFEGQRIFGSNKGIHIEFKSTEDANLFYQEGLKLGTLMEFHGTIVILLYTKKNKPS